MSRATLACVAIFDFINYLATMNEEKEKDNIKLNELT